MKRRKHEEEDHQKLIVSFCRKNNIPIQGSASGIYLPSIKLVSKLKSLGIIAPKGEPDLFISKVKRNKNGEIISGGLYIELKKIGGKATPEQLERISYYNNNGYVAKVVEGAENAINIILDYIK